MLDVHVLNMKTSMLLRVFVPLLCLILIQKTIFVI